MTLELSKALASACFTVIGSVIIFVLGQFCLKLVIEPIIDLRREIGSVANALVYYANIYVNPGGASKEVSDGASMDLRKHAASLREKSYAIILPNLWVRIGLIPPVASLSKAATCLIALSNFVYCNPDPATIIKTREDAEKALGIESVV
jgi:hypothetical protein